VASLDKIEGEHVWDGIQARITPAGKPETDEYGTRPWTVGLDGMVRQKGRAGLFGATGEGKSLAIVRMAEQCTRAGGRALYIDYENGKPRTERRLSLLTGFRDDFDDEQWEAWETAHEDAEARLRLAGPLDLRGLREHDYAWEQWLLYLRDFDLLIIDSLPRLLPKLGLDESSPKDVASFYGRFIDPIIESDHHRTAVVTADNTGWDERRVRGARSKIDMVEVAYRATGGKSCSEAEHGTVHLKLVRWRDGDEHRHLTLGAGGAEYTDLVPADDPASTEDAWHDAAVAVLGDAGALSRNALCKTLRDQGLKFNTQKMKEAIGGWIDDEHDEMTTTQEDLVCLIRAPEQRTPET